MEKRTFLTCKALLMMKRVTLLAEVAFDFLRQRHGQFIAGERQAAETARTFRSLTQPPANHRRRCISSLHQAEQAMQGARRAFDVWRKMPAITTRRITAETG